jgi:Fe-S-cluster-containing dehydrogenase component
MVIDLDKCFACQSCTAACRMENNTPVAGADQAVMGRAFMERVLPFAEGEYPNVTETLIPRPCMHCDDPACVKVCPVQATYKNEEGVVLIDYERCIGCRFCTVACPYQVRYFNWFPPEWPEALKAHLNPDPEVLPPQRRGGKAPSAPAIAQGASRPGEGWTRPRTTSRPGGDLHRPRALFRRSRRPAQSRVAAGCQPPCVQAAGRNGHEAESVLLEGRIDSPRMNTDDKDMKVGLHRMNQTIRVHLCSSMAEKDHAG